MTNLSVMALQRTIADLIEERFTPLAFTCDCNGTHPACAKVINDDRYAIGQHHTVTAIANWLRGKP
jgi:hypothetical protein